MRLFRRKPRVAKVIIEPNGVQSTTCPYCKANMRHIYKHITLMHCWNCDKVMKLEREEK